MVKPNKSNIPNLPYLQLWAAFFRKYEMASHTLFYIQTLYKTSEKWSTKKILILKHLRLPHRGI